MTNTRTVGLAVCLGVILGLPLGAVVARQSPAARWGREGAQHRLERFGWELGLTPDQQRQIAAILEGQRQKIDALRAEVRPRFEEVRAATNAEIRKILSPSQQTRFTKMQAVWEARRQRWRAGAPTS